MEGDDVLVLCMIILAPVGDATYDIEILMHGITIIAKEMLHLSTWFEVW